MFKGFHILILVIWSPGSKICNRRVKLQSGFDSDCSLSHCPHLRPIPGVKYHIYRSLWWKMLKCGMRGRTIKVTSILNMTLSNLMHVYPASIIQLCMNTVYIVYGKTVLCQNNSLGSYIYVTSSAKRNLIAEEISKALIRHAHDARRLIRHTELLLPSLDKKTCNLGQ